MENESWAPPRYLLPDIPSEGSVDNQVSTSYSNIPLVDREISWLQFNQRVIEQAKREDLPVSRYHFLCIAESNLNEFISVRFSDIVEESKRNLSSEMTEYLHLILYMIQIQKKQIDDLMSDRLQLELYTPGEDKSIFEKKIKSSICPILVGPNKDIPRRVLVTRSKK